MEKSVLTQIIAETFASPVWWVSTVVVALIVNLLSTYVYEFLKRKHRSFAWKYVIPGILIAHSITIAAIAATSIYFSLGTGDTTTATTIIIPILLGFSLAIPPLMYVITPGYSLLLVCLSVGMFGVLSTINIPEFWFCLKYLSASLIALLITMLVMHVEQRLSDRKSSEPGSS